MRRFMPLVLPLLLALGCATAPAPTPTTAPVPAPTPGAAAPVATAGTVDLAELTDDVRWVWTAAEYRAALWQAFALATERVEELAAGREPGTWAVSLDADETVLSNVQYEIERRGHAVEFDRDAWKAWVERREAVALPGARRFMQRVHELGGKVIVVSNRRSDEHVATEANLRALQLPFDILLTRDAESDKEGRWDAVAAGTAAPGVPPLEIVLWVGDNIRDFPHLDQDLAAAPESALAPFGDRFIVVPNPMYGSWKE
jgi:5'-nucleotidase (lipoprotein e(P4) family)